MSTGTKPLFVACRELYDKLRQEMGGMSAEKQLGMINAFLGSELIMSLMINEERGDVLMLQINGKSVRVFASPSNWDGLEVENGTKTQVVAFLQAVERRRQARRRSGHR